MTTAGLAWGHTSPKLGRRCAGSGVAPMKREQLPMKPPRPEPRYRLVSLGVGTLILREDATPEQLRVVKKAVDAAIGAATLAAEAERP